MVIKIVYCNETSKDKGTRKKLKLKLNPKTTFTHHSMVDYPDFGKFLEIKDSTS